MDIVGKFWSFCHKLRHDGVDSSDYIEQLTYLLFLKMAYEKGLEVPQEYNWTSLLAKNNGELVEHLDKVLHKLKEEKGILGEIFAEPISRIKNATILKDLIKEIDAIQWTKFDADVVGLAFEELIGRVANEGKKGLLDKFVQRFNILKNAVRQDNILSFEQCVTHYSRLFPKKIQKEDILEKGKYPIISQSHQEIIGYTNNDSVLFSNPLPIIIFGDHTRVFKYIDYPFVIYGDGVRVIVPNIEIITPKYLFYALKASYIPDLGYSRHFSEVKKLNIYVPSLEKQKEIVDSLDKQLDFLEKKEKRIEHEKKEIQLLKNSLFQHLLDKQANIRI